METLATYIVSTIAAFGSGAMLWTRFVADITSFSNWVSTIGIGIFAAAVIAMISRGRAPAFMTFIPGFWFGQVVALGPQPHLGESCQEFLVTLATINFAPAISSLGILLRHPLRQAFAVFVHRVASSA